MLNNIKKMFIHVYDNVDRYDEKNNSFNSFHIYNICDAHGMCYDSELYVLDLYVL